MTAAAESQAEPAIHLCCDDFPDKQEAVECQKPVVTPKHTATPAKVPQNQSMRPPQSPVVNAEPDALTEYPVFLNSGTKGEIKKYSNLPESDLEIPTEKRAAAILTAFHKKHTTIPAGQRNPHSVPVFMHLAPLWHDRIGDPSKTMAVLPGTLQAAAQPEQP